jgi:hypothetical protein
MIVFDADRLSLNLLQWQNPDQEISDGRVLCLATDLEACQMLTERLLERGPFHRPVQVQKVHPEIDFFGLDRCGVVEPVYEQPHRQRASDSHQN